MSRHAHRRLACTHRTLVAVSFVAVLALPGLALATTADQPRVPATIVVSAPGETMELELRDGSRFYGQVESVADDTIVFRTVGGAQVTVSRADIVLLRRARGRINEASEFIPADPNATRLFFGPTGRGLAAGSGYVGVYELFMPFVQVGVTNRISVGGGTPLFFGGDTSHPFWFTPKVQVYTGTSAEVAVGVMHITAFDDDEDYSVGIAYGVSTFGTSDRSITVGAGWGYTYEDDDSGGGAMGMVGGEYRVSRRLKVITENYVFENGGILSLGVRFIGDRLSADLALVLPVDGDDAFVFPMVNFVWTFGNEVSRDDRAPGRVAADDSGMIGPHASAGGAARDAGGPCLSDDAPAAPGARARPRGSTRSSAPSCSTSASSSTPISSNARPPACAWPSMTPACS